MIQVCSRCGTQWNVRDRQRMWCPRCRGPLLAPGAAATPAAGGSSVSSGPAGAQKLPPGFRWIAVRPGPPPPPRRRPRPLGPTPRYHTIPRWGLVDRVTVAGPESEHRPRVASETAVRATLLISAAVFAAAAGAHGLRYVLLLINRTRLLPPLLADGVLVMGVLASLAAIAASIATAAVAASWLIGRRAAIFGRHGLGDPRPEWALWTGCLTPVLNLVWAPVFVIELAAAENCRARLRGPITAWWIAWVVSTAISGWAIWTSSATEPQAVADNTVTMIVAYLAGLAALVLLWRVFDGFFGKPVPGVSHRWVVVADDESGQPAGAGRSGERTSGEGLESADAVESGDREPAA